MTYSAREGSLTIWASVVHLSALTGPLIPLAVYFASRDDDRFTSSEASKASQFASILLSAFIVATAVRFFVPLVGFLGTLAQWVIPIVAAYFCLAGFRLVRQGEPAHYPFQFKVVKTHD